MMQILCANLPIMVCDSKTMTVCLNRFVDLFLQSLSKFNMYKFCMALKSLAVKWGKKKVESKVVR